MRLSTAGLLLLLVGFALLSAFLTGNLDRWLGYLFAPPSVAPASASSASTALPSVGTQTLRVAA